MTRSVWTCNFENTAGAAGWADDSCEDDDEEIGDDDGVEDVDPTELMEDGVEDAIDDAERASALAVRTASEPWIVAATFCSASPVTVNAAVLADSVPLGLWNARTIPFVGAEVTASVTRASTIVSSLTGCSDDALILM